MVLGRQILPERQLQGRQVLPERLLMMKRHQQRSGRHLQLASQEERQKNSWKLNSSDTSWCAPLQVRCAGRITTKMSAYSSSDDVEDEGACEGEVNVHEARKVL